MMAEYQFKTAVMNQVERVAFCFEFTVIGSGGWSDLIRNGH